MSDTIDESAIISAATEKVLNELETKVPAFERRMIPETLAHEIAQQVGPAAAAALVAARAAAAKPST